MILLGMVDFLCVLCADLDAFLKNDITQIYLKFTKIKYISKLLGIFFWDNKWMNNLVLPIMIFSP